MNILNNKNKITWEISNIRDYLNGKNIYNVVNKSKALCTMFLCYQNEYLIFVT